MEEERVRCPLVDEDITPIECMENRDIREESIPERFKQKKDWKDILPKIQLRDY